MLSASYSRSGRKVKVKIFYNGYVLTLKYLRRLMRSKNFLKDLASSKLRERIKNSRFLLPVNTVDVIKVA